MWSVNRPRAQLPSLKPRWPGPQGRCLWPAITSSAIAGSARMLPACKTDAPVPGRHQARPAASISTRIACADVLAPSLAIIFMR